MKLEFSRRISEKSENVEFYETPSSESRVVPDGREDITKLILVSRNFANTPKNEVHTSKRTHSIHVIKTNPLRCLGGKSSCSL
jgi:hypothetical protein